MNSRTVTIVLLLFAFLQNSAAKKRQHSIVASNAAVATNHGQCSKIGINVLHQGGNAIDAYVAVALCLGVVNPGSSGLGGGSFAVVKMASGKEIAYDFREVASLRATEDMYGGNLELKKKGPLSVAVPGEVAGLFTAWKQLGKLPWKQLVYPAEKLAAEGYMISKYLYMQMNATRDDILADKGGLSELFASNGELKKPGTIVCNPKLAFTLKQIAEHGPKVFYNGTVGVNLVNDIQKLGGIVTLKDLHNYKVKVKKPLSNDILGYRLLGMPPPSSGGPSMVLILNILSQYGIPKGVAGPLGVHRLVEALKHAFAVRMNLGDPDFVDVIKVIVSDMLSPKFAQELKKKINDDKTFDPKYYGGKWNEIHDHGTSHFSIIDKERNVVAMTTTINGYFGPWGNKADGKVKAAVGASGGLYHSRATQVFLNHFFPQHGYSLFRHGSKNLPPAETKLYEDWRTVYNDHFELPKETRDVLENKGHVLTPIADGAISQLIVVESGGNSNGTNRLVAVSDPRKGGFHSGY
ncbi:hypothetical protein Bca52824_037772 [Brassica carinata]|uniref:Uncharacterized protein n=2 Tax=Brassica TaxID=3705 RepID=A0A8X7RNG5_BRACI|nr:hypothetical protein Bca52824_037772 [Brassica carinata]